MAGYMRYAMPRIMTATIAILIATNILHAQTAPSYSKDIRPFLAKYCLECHNAKSLKGNLDLESHKTMMDGSDVGPVIKAGIPDESKLVLLTEHKSKPVMPPAKAKFQPTKDEIKLLRAWVAAGAKDDAVEVKVELPVIKANANALPPVTALAYPPMHDQLYIARQNTLTLIDFNIGVHSMQFARNPISITSLAVVPGANRLIQGVSESAKRGDAIGFSHGLDTMGIQTLGHKDGLLDLVHHPTQPFVASASYDTEIRLTKLDGKSPAKSLHVIKEHSDAVYGLAFNPDGSQLASVSADRAMKVFDVKTGKLLYTLGEATDWLYTVAWSPNGKYLVSGGVDKSIRVYEPTPIGAKLRQSVFAHEGPVQKVLFSNDSKTLYSVGQDRVIKAWDIEKMVERKVYDKQPETVLCMALREDAGQIIIGRYDGIVQLIDMKSGKVSHEFGKEKQQPKPRGERSEPLGFASPDPKGSLRSSLGLPGKITKTLDRAGAVHTHPINAIKGQPLGIRITKKVAASKFEPVLTITDDAGRIIADSNDAHLGQTFADAGKYTLSVRDREYRGGSDFQYELEIGEIPIVTAVFPMGVQRGTKADIEISGVFLPKKSVSIDVPTTAKPGDMIPLDIGKGVLGKAQIVVGEWPDSTSGKLSVPATANGRLPDKQNNLWTFDARKGQPLVVEVNARRLGSRLDSVIEILDANDQPVPRAVLRSQAKTHVTFRDHDSAQGNIRIEAWSELNTNDYLFVGNDLMKIQALPTHPDADCNFFKTDNQRIGYLGTTPTHHANGEPMYKVTLHPPGTTFPPNGFPVFTIFYRNDDGGPGFGRDSYLIFDPPADGTYKVRIADARGMAGVNFGYRLTVRPPNPHFTLQTSPANPVVSKGGSIPITITAQRIDGFDGPIKIEVSNMPAGLHLPMTTIEAGTYATTVALYADANAVLPANAKSANLRGSTFATALPYSSIANFNIPKLIEPGDLVTTVKENAVAIKPGAQAKMTVTIERRNGFKGRVPLEVRGLPHGVRVLDIGLNGILINENETMRTVVIYAEPWVQAAEHPFVVLAKREGKNSEHGAKSVLLQVK
jgi:hypothetical protein